MPVDANTTKSFTDLGIAGAALLIVLILVILVISYQFKITKNSNASVDKLCNRIDQLVTLTSTYLVTNDKDQKEMLRIMMAQQAILNDIQLRIVRIDDRTYSCLGMPQKIRELKEEVKEKEETK